MFYLSRSCNEFWFDVGLVDFYVARKGGDLTFFYFNEPFFLFENIFHWNSQFILRMKKGLWY